MVVSTFFQILSIMEEAGDSSRLMLKVVEHLSAAQDTLKKNQRNAEILAEAGKFKNVSTRRNVKYNRELLFNIEDMEDLFKTEKEDEDFVTEDNVAEANLAIKRFKELLQDHKKAVQHELNMVVVADASPLKWQTVSQLEGGLELPSCVTIPSSDVRKAEKDTMAFARELNAAKNARKRFGSQEVGGRAKYGRGGVYRGRGGRGGAVSARGASSSSGGVARGRACFKCGDSSHYVAQCDK